MDTIGASRTHLDGDRDSLLRRYCAVRAQTERLAAPLSPEDQTVQSMGDVSPTKWHRAHTSWFFENFLLIAFKPRYREYHPIYGYLFNSYYEGAGARHPRPERGLLSRPSVAEVARYRAHVDRAMEGLIAEAGTATWGEIVPLLELGLNHEEQHQELILMDIKHVLSLNPLDPAYADRPLPRRHTGMPLTFLGIDGGLSEIGHGGGNRFAFDNEGPRHKVWLEPYRIGTRLAANTLPSSRRADIASRNYGCPKVGRRSSAKVGRHRFIGGATRRRGRSSPLRAADRWCPRSRCATSVTTKRMPSRAGQANACRPRPNGRLQRPWSIYRSRGT
jgi:hypothetical protein